MIHMTLLRTVTFEMFIINNLYPFLMPYLKIIMGLSRRSAGPKSACLIHLAITASMM